MASDDKSIKLIIETILKDEQFKKGMKEFSQSTQVETKKAEVSITGLIKKIAGIGTSLLVVKKSLDFAYDSLLEFAKSEKGIVNLGQAFKKAGQDVETSTKKFSNFAEAQQEITKYEDDAIITAGAHLEAITKLSEDGLEKATLAAMNFASATDTELNTAMEMIGTSIEGTRNFFKKYGIELDENASKSEKTASLVDQLAKKFGGFAEKEGKTAIGQIERLKNQFGNLKEQIGEALIPTFNSMMPFLKKGMQIFAELPGYVKLLTVAIIALIPVVGGLNLAFGPVITAIAAISAALVVGGIKFKQYYDDVKRLEGLKAVSVGAQRITKEIDEISKAIYGLNQAVKAPITIKGQIGGIPSPDEIKKRIDEIQKIVNRGFFEKGIEIFKLDQTEITFLKQQIEKLKTDYAGLGKKQQEVESKTAEYTQETLEKRKQVYDEFFASTITSLAKELSEENKKYKEATAVFRTGTKEREDIDKQHKQNLVNISDKARKDFFGFSEDETQNAINQANRERDEKIIAINQYYAERLRLAKQNGESEKDIEIEKQEATQNAYKEGNKKVLTIVNKQTTDMIESFKSVTKIVGAIWGEDWQQMADSAINILMDIASSNWVKLLSDSVALAVNMIVKEIEKANKATEILADLNMKNLTDVELAKANEKIRILEGVHAQELKFLDEQQKAEMAWFEISSATGQAYNAMKTQEEADRVAAMDASERTKYEIEKKYNDEKDKMEKKQAADKLALEEKQKAERNKAKQKQFNAQKAIEKARVIMDWAKAESEVHKQFPMPWDEGTRNKLLSGYQGTYGKILKLIAGQEFVPEYATGADSLASDQFAKIHRGERIIPANMNIPNISNDQLMSSALAGMTMGNKYSTVNNTTTNNNNARNINVNGANFNGIQNVKDLFRQLQVVANGMGVSLV